MKFQTGFLFEAQGISLAKVASVSWRGLEEGYDAPAIFSYSC